MILTDIEKKEVNLINQKISNINQQIFAKVKSLSGDNSKKYSDVYEIDINNLEFTDERLVRMLIYRENLRKKYTTIASRIWDGKTKEEHYEEL